MMTTHDIAPLPTSGLPSEAIQSQWRHKKRMLSAGSARGLVSRPVKPTRSAGSISLLSLGLVLALATPSSASIAYGSINNFDTVNDTGEVCHGFEIEIDNAHSKDITYTYDYNHYGVPKITEDTTDPTLPKVFIRYASAKNPNGTWAAYTAVPAGPISPTDGHQFTNPSVNFGGEHFGVGFYGSPSAIKYSWLKDDGAGNLVFAGAVNISTPVFTYVPPVPGVAANVQAEIEVPEPPEAHQKEFGDAVWVKETRTTSHKNNRVELKDLVSDDPNDPNAKSWRNGEPAEVEVEWELLQTDFNAVDKGKNGKAKGKPEKLPNNDEVVTRRYDFFKYVGPLDPENGEALAEKVGADGTHGTGTYANTVVVGDYIGAQMAAFDAANKIGLIDHLQDGEKNAPYVERTIVVGGTAPIVTKRTGALPDGMAFDEVTGVLSGTPTVTGTFTFTVHSTDANKGDVTNTFTLTIAEQAPFNITASASPPQGGSVLGDGNYAPGTDVTVMATANAGYVFENWTENGVIVSALPNYVFTATANRTLVANFARTAVDVSSQIQVIRGGFRYNRATGRFIQTVILKNISGGVITGLVSLALDGMSANASLFNKTDVTAATAPAGSPYLDVTAGDMATDASVTVTLEFTNTDKNKGIIYVTRVLAGSGIR